MPNTREKLIELLKNIDVAMPITTAEYLIAGGVTVQKWIPVSERLPEKSNYYLAFTDTGIIGVLPFSAQYKLFNAFDGDGTKHNIPVTHWMPLPEPPKGE